MPFTVLWYDFHLVVIGFLPRLTFRILALKVSYDDMAVVISQIVENYWQEEFILILFLCPLFLGLELPLVVVVFVLAVVVVLVTGLVLIILLLPLTTFHGLELQVTVVTACELVVTGHVVMMPDFII